MLTMAIEPRMSVTAPAGFRSHEVLSGDALGFLTDLCQEFEPARQRMLKARRERQAELRRGALPDFLPHTREVREAEWAVAPLPQDLKRRAVEITGPVDRKMVINALNSGADCFMADFEDSNSPVWHNTIGGQVNLMDAVRRGIEYKSPEGKQYRLNDKTATLLVRPRGWHLMERHLKLDGQAVSASLVDFGLFFFHNAQELLERGTAPYFYLPKLESHLEARLWNDVFNWAQDRLGIERGTIRATVLIETILAAFEMEEILYELREHSAGLNCGRWDYIFSMIKKFSGDPGFVLPDRAKVTMTTPFMRNYSLLAIKTCHKRGAQAIGGMAAQIPIKDDPSANQAALDKVREDKRREYSDGHDGTWVAHPGLVSIAAEEFKGMKDHQIERELEDVHIAAADLLPCDVAGTITEEGIRTNVSVGIQYMESWLRGQGCVPINNLMEDAATAEISRAQLWQWAHHGVKLNDGRLVTVQLIERIMDEECARLRDRLGQGRFETGKFEMARHLMSRMTRALEFPEFLTSVACEYLD